MDPIDTRYVFDHPTVHQLFNIVEEATQDRMQVLHLTKCESEHKLKIFSLRIWRKKNLFIKSNKFNFLFDTIDDENELDVKIHDYEQKENGFSFDCVVKLNKKNVI